MIARPRALRPSTIACTLAAITMVLPCASEARKSKSDKSGKDDEIRLTPSARRVARSYDGMLKTAASAITREIPKIDSSKVKDYMQVAEAAAAAGAEEAAAYKAATAKEVSDRKTLEAAHKMAQEKLAKAQETLDKAAAEILSEIEPFLSSDSLDNHFYTAGMIAMATPEKMAATTRDGRDPEDAVRLLIKDESLIRQVAIADGASNGMLGQAMQIYADILKISDKAKEGPLQRLALGTALQHAVPVSQHNPDAAKNAPAIVDPVKRYLHYEKAYLDGELDPNFPKLTVWEMRHVTNSYAPDEALAWGREMLRNYRPDHIHGANHGWSYTALVKTDVKYGSEDVGKDDPTLHFYQNILANGGVCGRRAFFGRFIARAFGIPVYGVTQKAHAAVGRWTPDGWLVNLGASFQWSWWDKDGERMSGTQFLTETQARSVHPEFMKVLRARWISHLLGETQFNDRNHIAGGFWSNLSYQKARQIAANIEELGPVGEELGEANDTEVVVQMEVPGMTNSDRRVRSTLDGTIIVPAASLIESTGAVQYMMSYAGGAQLCISRDFKQDQSFTFKVNSETAGDYILVARICTVQKGQKLIVNTGNGKPAEIPLPYTLGMWEATKPVEVKLQTGENLITFTRPAPGKGIAFKEFAMQPAGR